MGLKQTKPADADAAVAPAKEEEEEEESVDWPVWPAPPEGTETLALSHKRVRRLPSLSACAGSLKDLHVRRCGLRGGHALSAELSQCRALRTVDLSYNLLRVSDDVVPLLASVLPAETLERLLLRRAVAPGVTPVPLGDEVPLGRFAKMVVLDLGECMLSSLPASLGEMAMLTELRLQKNMIERFPDSVGRLARLELLDVTANSLSEIPASLGQCAALRVLLCGRNRLTTLPDELAGLQALHTLKLFPSNMSQVPRVVYSLRALQHLDFSGTTTHEIGAELGSLANLVTLKLRWNKLSALPDEAMAKLTALQLLDLSGNEALETLPALPPSCSTLAIAYTHVPQDAAPQSVETLFTESGFVRWNPQSAQVHPANELPRWQLPSGVSGAEDLLDHFLGTIFGGAIGDAIGLATEFMSKKQANAEYGVGPLDYGTFLLDNHRSRWDSGDFTDDTDQAVLLMRNVVQNDGVVNAKTLAAALLEWAKGGFPELGDVGGLGIGRTVSSVLRHESFLGDPHRAAREVWERMGKSAAPNGAVMRTAVLGLVNFADPEAVERNTREACLVTHTDPRCIASCVAVTTAVSAMLRGERNPAALTELAISAGIGAVAPDEAGAFADEFRRYMQCPRFVDAELDDGSAIGFTFKTLGAGFVALRLDDFERAITEVSLQAGDADTNGAVAGALLGCKLGFRRLPGHWLDGLLHKAWLMSEAEALWRVAVLKNAKGQDPSS